MSHTSPLAFDTPLLNDTDAETARQAAIASLPMTVAFALDAEPISFRNGVLTVALIRENREVVDRIKFETRAKGIVVEIKTIDKIRQALNVAYPQESFPTDEAATKRIFQDIIDEAVRMHAGDVFIEPVNHHGDGQVRIAIDGLLEPSKRHPTLPRATFSRLVGLIRSTSDVKPNNSNLPGDGRLTIKSEGRDNDLRISTLPAGPHQRVCIRFLSQILTLRSLPDLGMDERLHRKFHAGISRPGAFVTIAGPVGSGKSTTAYAALVGLDLKRLNVNSIENPIECYIAGIFQIPIAVEESQASRSGQMTFDGAARALLRQLPHFVFLGEIRDEETLDIAMTASTTGTSLLSTIHAYDAIRTIIRLETLGANRAQIAQSMTMATSQRLLRKLCLNCRVPTNSMSKKGVQMAGLFKVNLMAHQIYRSKPEGCDQCRHTGYADRIGAFEVLEFSGAVRDALESGSPIGTIARIAISEGFRPMAISALEHVAAGLTDELELKRLLSYEDASTYIDSGAQKAPTDPSPPQELASEQQSPKARV